MTSDDPRTNEELVQLALTLPEDQTWEPVGVLWYRPPGLVFALARELTTSSDPRRRELGAKILAQGTGIRDRVAPDDSLALLLPLLGREQDPAVLCAIGHALGQIADIRAVTPLLRFKNHPDADVRWGVVQGLLNHATEPAVATLVELSHDADTNVRSWATFGLAQLDQDDPAAEVNLPLDSPAIRAALWARATDADDETRGEALLGLARRGCTQVVERLLQELGTGEVRQLVFEAAIEAGKQLGDPRLYAELVRLRAVAASEGEREALEEAIARCQPHKVIGR
ncbi:MAG TPA: hypothetical protein VKY74_01535 [Chloroflexia bacterium]|nr:hypothetical protein [Chloroflexia bacterium]